MAIDLQSAYSALAMPPGPAVAAFQPARRHVVITGIGRSGTSFLIQLLTNLGLETGFAPGKLDLDENAKAGLEWDLRNDDAPYITKTPGFCEWGGEILSRKEIVIEHVFIPMRDLYEAAESRRCVQSRALARLPWFQRLRGKLKPRGVPGGLWLTKNGRDQEQVLQMHLYNLMLALSGDQVPVTLLQYPRLAQDCAYLFQKLTPILQSCSPREFSLVFEQTVRPQWIHNYSNPLGTCYSG